MSPKTQTIILNLTMVVFWRDYKPYPLILVQVKGTEAFPLESLPCGGSVLDKEFKTNPTKLLDSLKPQIIYFLGPLAWFLLLKPEQNKWARRLSVVPRDRTRSNGHRLKHRKLHLHMTKLFHCEGDKALVQVAQEGCGIPIPGDIKNPSGYDSGQPAVSGPAWTGQG